MKKEELVSVIIPTYKGNKKRIIESLNSVINQTYKNLEIIIINDEPDADMECFFCDLQKRDSRIVYVKNLKKINIGKALNQGIFLSHGIYIARIDDDDIWSDKNKIKKQVEFLDENSDYGVCGVNKIIIIDENGFETGRRTLRIDDFNIRDHILQSNQLAHPSIMIRKSALEMSGIYNPSCITEDYDLWLRIGCFYKFKNIDSEIKYRIRKNSISHNNLLKNRISAFKVYRKYKKYYPHSIRGFILRLGELILPEKVTNYILKLIKK